MDDLEASIARRTDGVKQYLRSLPPTMSKGQRALEALSMYRAARLPVPDDVIRQIDKCYRHFVEGKPVSYSVGVERKMPAPLTLGEAFEVPDLRGGEKAALKRKRLAMAQPELVALFTGQGVNKLPRTKEGYAEAASTVGLTVSEVEDWVTKYMSARRSKKSLS